MIELEKYLKQHSEDYITDIEQLFNQLKINTAEEKLKALKLISAHNKKIFAVSNLNKGCALAEKSFSLNGVKLQDCALERKESSKQSQVRRQLYFNDEMERICRDQLMSSSVKSPVDIDSIIKAFTTSIDIERLQILIQMEIAVCEEFIDNEEADYDEYNKLIFILNYLKPTIEKQGDVR